MLATLNRFRSIPSSIAFGTANPPTEWSENENIKWKVAIPGFGSSTPVIWGDRVFGEHVYVSFGSRGVYCYDLDGKRVWERDLGDMQTRNSFGEGASPALHGDTLVINWDHEGDDFIVALDKRTGETRWRKDRAEPTGWSTPLIVDHNNRPQVVVNATSKVLSYDLASGDALWELGGQTANAIPSPVAQDGVVYVTSGFRGSALFAIKLGASGDLAGTDAILWSHDNSTPYVPSPLLYEDLLYLVSVNSSRFSCFDTGTGKAHFEAEPLPGLFGIYASPVAAAGRVYVMGRDGTAVVLKAGPKLEVLATNKLDDKVDASLALVDGELFVRGHQYLYCIAE